MDSTTLFWLSFYPPEYELRAYQFSWAIRVCESLRSITHLGSNQLKAEVQRNWHTTELQQGECGGSTGESACETPLAGPTISRP
jgi:hypothetical protein